MSTDNENRKNDRDENLQKQDRDQKLQHQDRDQLKQSQDRGMNMEVHATDEEGIPQNSGNSQQITEGDQNKPQHTKDKEDQKSQSPGKLQDADHKMDRRLNDVESDDNLEHKDPKGNKDSNLTIERRWNVIESAYRKRYPAVTDEDVQFRSGEFDAMTDRLAKRTNQSREAVTNEIENWND